MKNSKKGVIVSGLAFLLASGLQVSMANAAELRCRADNRNNTRSRISVDVKNVASGQYNATVKSGDGEETSPLKATIGDEVQFDFDSNPKDIKAGATAIAKTFVSGTTSAVVKNASGGTVISGDCSIR
jgi:hypothetical protein